MDVGGPSGSGWRAAGAEPIARAEPVARADGGQKAGQRWLEQAREAIDRVAPDKGRPAAHAADPVALGEARAHIAELLAEVEQLQQAIAGSPARAAPFAMPLSPGASDQAVAAAQAVAEMIAANARPAIAAQAALPADAVRSMVG